MFVRTMPLLTELGNSFAFGSTKMPPPTGLGLAERGRLFVVSVAVGEGESRNGGTAAFQHEPGNSVDEKISKRLGRNPFGAKRNPFASLRIPFPVFQFRLAAK